jgi:hypothetical protein
VPTPPLKREVAEQTIKLVEKCIEDGFVIGGSPSAIEEAGRRLKISPSTVATRLRGAKRLHGLEPKYEPPAQLDIPEQVESDRKKRLDRDLAAENKRLRDALMDAEDIRAGVLKLVDPPLRPRLDTPAIKSTKRGSRTVIIHLSDWHCGEVVDIDEMEGLNCFNLRVFQDRVGRLGRAAKELLTTHWKGSPPEKIVLIFGGDMITGEIHSELAKTNDALSAPAVRECAETLAGLVKMLREIAPIDIYSLPGNHGRLTLKPESKGMAVNSFDTLITQVVEMVVKLSGSTGIRFFYPKSGDAVFRVYGLTFVAAHGDRVGSRGGQGFIGPIATILRGIAKTRAYYAAQGVIVDYVMIGHFHTTSKLPRGFSNGSLVGPSEYSRDLKADPEESKQNLIVVHNSKGIIDFQELKCGDPKEGAIYRARAA